MKEQHIFILQKDIELMSRGIIAACKNGRTVIYLSNAPSTHRCWALTILASYSLPAPVKTLGLRQIVRKASISHHIVEIVPQRRWVIFTRPFTRMQGLALHDFFLCPDIIPCGVTVDGSALPHFSLAQPVLLFHLRGLVSSSLPATRKEKHILFTVGLKFPFSRSSGNV